VQCKQPCFGLIREHVLRCPIESEDLAFPAKLQLPFFLAVLAEDDKVLLELGIHLDLKRFAEEVGRGFIVESPACRVEVNGVLIYETLDCPRAHYHQHLLDSEDLNPLQSLDEVSTEGERAHKSALFEIKYEQPLLMRQHECSADHTVGLEEVDVSYSAELEEIGEGAYVQVLQRELLLLIQADLPVRIQVHLEYLAVTAPLKVELVEVYLNS
jgi:hypothetical protein